MAQSEVMETPNGHGTGSVQFPLKVCGDPTVSVRAPYGFVSERQQKPEQDRIICKHIRRGSLSPTMSDKIVGKFEDQNNRMAIGANVALMASHTCGKKKTVENDDSFHSVS